jgi:hypothetical protein
MTDRVAAAVAQADWKGGRRVSVSLRVVVPSYVLRVANAITTLCWVF